MQRFPIVALLFYSIGIGIAHAQGSPPAADPPPVLRDHVDTTVVGDAVPDNASVPAAAADMSNNHHFEAGAPEIVAITKQLHLSARQEKQIEDSIQRADAGAAVLIKREHDLAEMVSATTPQDPLYAKLIHDQAAGVSLWSENRENLRREVLNLLTPQQQKRFEALQPKE